MKQKKKRRRSRQKLIKPFVQRRKKLVSVIQIENNLPYTRMFVVALASNMLNIEFMRYLLFRWKWMCTVWSGREVSEKQLQIIFVPSSRVFSTLHNARLMPPSSLLLLLLYVKEMPPTKIANQFPKIFRHSQNSDHQHSLEWTSWIWLPDYDPSVAQSRW